MRCLYCGKELALLKRWTSGGEFCSDAHRQRYQEEYNQLALKRLQQAKPQREEKTAMAEKTPSKEIEKPVEKLAEKKSAESVAKAPAKTVPALEAPKHVEPPKLVEAPKPVTPRIEEKPAPAEAGFFLEFPVPVAAGATTVAVPEAEFDRQPAPVLPSFASEIGRAHV